VIRKSKNNTASYVRMTGPQHFDRYYFVMPPTVTLTDCRHRSKLKTLIWLRIWYHTTEISRPHRVKGKLRSTSDS